MKLYLTEKPKTARQLCDVLGASRHVKSSANTTFGGHKVGDGWMVTWLSGHFFRLLEPQEYNPDLKRWSLRDLPIVYPTIEWKPIDSSDTIPVAEITEQIEHIKSLYPKVTQLILATDGDQEGQLLGQVFLEQTGWSGPVARLWTDLWEPSGLRNSLTKVRDNAFYSGTYHAGLSRMLLDQLLGINLTRLYTIKAQQSGYNMVANTGRVRSSSLAIVVDHDEHVRAHTSREYYSIRAKFTFNGVPFLGKFSIPDHLLADKTHCFDKAAIESIIRSLSEEKIARLIDISSTEARTKPPKPFSQNTLAQFCNLHFTLLPDETLAACQSLYEAGYLSYPRVEAEVYETSVLSQAPAILATLASLNDTFNASVLNADLKQYQPVFVDAEIDGHGAIFVSELRPNFSNLKPNELIVYSAVANRFIAQFSSDMITANTTMKLLVKDQTFIAESLILKSVGWSSLEPRSITEKPQLPPMEVNNECEINEISLHSRNTKAPPRLTVDTFLAILKDCTKYLSPKIALRIGTGQIGTGATQPGIIKTLEAQGVAQVVEKKYLVPTKRGRDLRKLLPDLIASADLTSIWELNFRAIRSGQLSHNDFIKGGLDWIQKIVESGKESNFPKSPTLTPCELCGSAMNRKQNAYKKEEHYWQCTCDECRLSVPDVSGLPMKLHAEHGKPCPKCTDKMVSRAGKIDKKPELVCKNKDCNKKRVN
ncbi:DNA topoisomerase [Cellvibrio sp. QJXJ]|uniref:DNA topoisomerase n=1 Tax=Cellvibrio sp. QJXJ TaxID=2964606 RepID=UPI0021C27A07|nr:DNA topoisomerase [Cellvibrio sp. QJXJ]UUA75116.1 DNA topoisomerase [Cellvibrio sp. QJXJ]